MPKRKFGNVTGKSLKERTKVCLQRLGYNSFEALPLIDQLKSSDLKIKFDRESKVDLVFTSLPINQKNKIVFFEGITCTVSKCKFSFVLYTSEKNEWRCYVPTKGNYFCKKKKKSFGFCGCHSDVGNIPFSGSFYEDVQKRMQFGGYINSSLIKIKNAVVDENDIDDSKWKDNSSMNIANISSSRTETPKRGCHPRCFEKISGVKDLIWVILSFVPHEELFSICERVSKLWQKVIRNQVFQKELWKSFKDQHCMESFGIMSVEEIQGLYLDFPGKFTIGLDGVFESLNYSLSGKQEEPVYYNLNKIHVILPTLMEHVRQLNSEYDVFPSPFGESLPTAIILRRDLNHKYVEDSEQIRYDLKKMEVDRMGYADVDDAIVSLKRVYLQTKNKIFFREFSEAQRVISKICRATCEIEYFDHIILGGGSQFGNEEMKNKYVSSQRTGFFYGGGNRKRSIRDRFRQGQEKISDFFEGYFGYMYEDEKDKVDRFKRIVEDLKKVCKNVTLYKVSQRMREESGVLFIVGEFSDQFLIGYSWEFSVESLL